MNYKRYITLFSLVLSSFLGFSQMDSLLDGMSVTLTAQRIFADEAQLYIDKEIWGTDAIQLKAGIVYPNKYYTNFVQKNLESNWSNFSGFFLGLGYRHYYLHARENQLYWAARITYKKRSADSILVETEGLYSVDYLSYQDITTVNAHIEMGQDFGSMNDKVFFQLYGGVGMSYHWIDASYRQMTPIEETTLSHRPWENNNTPRFTTAIEARDAGTFFSPTLHFGFRVGYRL